MTNLFSTSGLIKTAECFAVFTCLVIHRIGNRGSQVNQLAVILRLLRGVAWEYYEYCQYVIDNLLCRYLLWCCLGMVRDNRFRDGLQGDTVRGELIMLTSVSKSAPVFLSCLRQVDAEIIGCGSLTCMCIVSLTILFSYLIEGREVVQVRLNPTPKNTLLLNLKIFHSST